MTLSYFLDHWVTNVFKVQYTTAPWSDFVTMAIDHDSVKRLKEIHIHSSRLSARNKMHLNSNDDVMDNAVVKAVQRIHESPTKAVVYVTGGAATSLSWLLGQPGASNTILEAVVPYSHTSFQQLIARNGESISSHASPEAACALAQSAYHRAVRLARPGTRVVGVAAACALVSTRALRGDHRACVAAYSSSRVVEYGIRISKKEGRTRADEDVLTSRLLLQALLDDCGASDVVLSLSKESNLSLMRLHVRSADVLSVPVVQEHADCVSAVLDGDAKFAERMNGVWNREANVGTIIMPGSFNPVHEGHKKLLRAARMRYPDASASVEISISNPDKASIETEAVRKRVAQFDGMDYGVIVSAAPMFTEKARLYGAVKFVVGVDTAVRIVSPKYYEKGGLIRALTQLKVAGCTFVVGGRLEQRNDGVKSDTFQTMTDVNVPEGFEDMFEEIGEQTFRVDLSSTDLRAHQGKDGAESGECKD